MSAEQKGIRMPTPEQRKARLELATRFLDEVLLPRIKENFFGDLEDAKVIPEWYRDFQQQNAGLGDDFDLGHSWSEAWQRDLVNVERAIRDPNSLPPDAVDITVAVGLLEHIIFDDKLDPNRPMGQNDTPA